MEWEVGAWQSRRYFPTSACRVTRINFWRGRCVSMCTRLPVSKHCIQVDVYISRGLVLCLGHHAHGYIYGMVFRRVQKLTPQPYHPEQPLRPPPRNKSAKDWRAMAAAAAERARPWTPGGSERGPEMDAMSSAARQHYQAMLDGDCRGARDSEGRAAEEGEEERREGKSGRGQSDPAPKKAAGAFDNTVKTIGAAWAQVTTPLKSWATPLAAGAVDACPDPLKNAIGTCKDGLAKGVERVGSSVSRVVSETRHSELQRDAVAERSSPGAVPGDSEESHDAQTARAGSLGVCAFVSSLCLCMRVRAHVGAVGTQRCYMLPCGRAVRGLFCSHATSTRMLPHTACALARENVNVCVDMDVAACTGAARRIANTRAYTPAPQDAAEGARVPASGQGVTSLLTIFASRYFILQTLLRLLPSQNPLSNPDPIPSKP